jgi:hypothetical protein
MDLTEYTRMDPHAEQRHPWEKTRARIILHLLKKKLPVTHLLDVGSGDAFISGSLSDHRLAKKYSAVDPAFTPAITGSLKKKYPPLDFFASVTEAAAVNGSADLVLLMDVLEHLPDESGLLEALQKDGVTSHSTMVVITVPAFQALFSGHDRTLGHYRRYTRKKLVALCARHHLRVITSGYFFFSLLPFRLAQKTIGYGSSGAASVERWRVGKAGTALTQALLWMDFRISRAFSAIGIHLPGLSCYCLCQKSPS